MTPLQSGGGPGEGALGDTPGVTPEGILLARKGASLIKGELQKSSQLFRKLFEVLLVFRRGLSLLVPSSGI